MAVGLGCFFILGVRAMQANLLAEFDDAGRRQSPDLVLIDVQPDQVEGVRAAVAPYAREPPRARAADARARRRRRRPRACICANAEAVREQGRLTREFGLTYRDALAGATSG